MTLQAIGTYTLSPVETKTPYRIIVGNNPVNKVDPMGLWICDTICTLIPVPWWAAPICDLICPTELPEPVVCPLLTSAISGDSKLCYYECKGTEWPHIGIVTVGKCDECPPFAAFDPSNYGRPF